MTKENRDLLVKSIKDILTTHDMRYIFLKIAYPHALGYINIEGTPYEAANQIYFYFEKINFEKYLVECMNKFFLLNLSYD